MNAEEVRRVAREELEEERFRAAVEKHKEHLRRRRWWHVVFPWVITITRRETNG